MQSTVRLTVLVIHVICLISTRYMAMCKVEFLLAIGEKEGNKFLYGDVMHLEMRVNAIDSVGHMLTLIIYMPDTLHWVANSTLAQCRRNAVNNICEKKQYPLGSSLSVPVENYRLVKYSDAPGSLPNKTRKLVLMNDTSRWLHNTTTSIELTLSNLYVETLETQQAIVAILHIVNNLTRNNQELTSQQNIKQIFLITPVKVAMQFKGEMTNRTSLDVFIGHPFQLDAVAVIDNRGLPIEMELQLLNMPMDLLEYVQMLEAKIVLSPGAKPISSTVTGSIVKFTVEKSQCSGKCTVNASFLIQPLHDNLLTWKINELQFKFVAIYGSAKGDGESIPESSQILTTKFSGPRLLVEATGIKAGIIYANQALPVTITVKHGSQSRNAAVIHKLSLENLGVPWLKITSVTASAPLHLTLSSPTEPVVKYKVQALYDGMTVGLLKQQEIFTINFVLNSNKTIPLNYSSALVFDVTYSALHSPDYPCGDFTCKNGGLCRSATCSCGGDFGGADCTTRGTSCKPGWKLYSNNNCYFKPSNNFLANTDAQLECAKANAFLPSVRDPGNDLFALSKFWTDDSNWNTTARGIARLEVWIGLYRATRGAPWGWYDGSRAQYLDWTTGETFDFNCASISPSNVPPYSWTTHDCKSKLDFFCHDTPKPGSGVVFNARTKIQIKTATVHIDDVQLPLGPTIRVHESVQSDVRLKVPVGKLKNVSILFDFEFDPEIVDITFPMNFIGGEIKHSDGDLLRIEPNSDKNFTISKNSGRRKKRATSNNIVVMQNIGDVHFQPTDATKTMGDIDVKTIFVAKDPSLTNASFSLTMALTFDNSLIILAQNSSKFVEPSLSLIKTISPSPDVTGGARVTTEIKHNENSTGAALAINYEDEIMYFTVHGISPDTDVQIDKTRIRVRRNALNVGEKLILMYDVTPNADLHYGRNQRNASLNYSSLRPGEIINPNFPGKSYGPIEVSTCVERDNNMKLFGTTHLHAISVVALLISVIISFFVTLIVLSLLYRHNNKNKDKLDDDDSNKSTGDSASNPANSRSRPTTANGTVSTGIDPPDIAMIPTPETNKNLSKITHQPLSAMMEDRAAGIIESDEEMTPSPSRLDEARDRQADILTKLMEGSNTMTAEEQEQLLHGAATANAKFQSNLARQKIRQEREMKRRKQLMEKLKENSVVKNLEKTQEKKKKFNSKTRMVAEILAELQLQKSRQITALREQEDALLSLRTCVMNNLSEKEKIPDGDFNTLLQTHRSEKNLIRQRLEKQKAKMHQELVKRRRERMEERSKASSEASSGQTSRLESPVADIDQCLSRVNMIYDDIVETQKQDEEAESSMSKEMDQLQRQHEFQKQKLLNKQESNLVKSLLDKGKFDDEEIFLLAKALLPGKSKQQIKSFVKEIDPNLAVAESAIVKKISTDSKDRINLDEQLSRVSALNHKIQSTKTQPPKIFNANALNKSVPRQLPPISLNHRNTEEISQYLPPKRMSKIKI